ncbi:hypothetical protein ACDY96_14980 [Rhizobium mongolense]
MKESQFTDAQKGFILKQGDEGVSVAKICRKAAIAPWLLIDVRLTRLLLC